MLGRGYSRPAEQDPGLPPMRIRDKRPCIDALCLSLSPMPTILLQREKEIAAVSASYGRRPPDMPYQAHFLMILLVQSD